MVRGILLALAAATIYGFLGISFEIAAKRHYPVWDVILYKQLTGFLIGLGLTMTLGLSLYRPCLIGLGLIGAVAYVITLAAILRHHASGILPQIGRSSTFPWRCPFWFRSSGSRMLSRC